MKLLARLFPLCPAVVIGALPNTLVNGQTADATPLMANFNWIVNQVNAAGIALTSLTPQLASANTFTGLQSGISATQLANFPIATQIINASLTDCGNAGGTANALTLTTAITIAAYAAGQAFSFIATASNSGAATVNVDALGAKSIVNLDASALAANQIKSGGSFSIRYDGTNFQLLNPNLKTVAGGGTGAATLAAHGVVIGNGTSAVSVSGAGTSGQVLTSNGASADPTFQNVTAAGMTLLATVTPTAAANVDFLSTFTSSYDAYLVIGNGLRPAADDFMLLRLATAGAADTGSNYCINAASGALGAAGTSATLSGTVTTAGIGVSFAVMVSNTNDATRIKRVRGDSVCQSAAAPTYTTRELYAAYIAANTVSGLRLYWSGGSNFAAVGSVRVYGLSNT